MTMSVRERKRELTAGWKDARRARRAERHRRWVCFWTRPIGHVDRPTSSYSVTERCEVCGRERMSGI